MKKAFVPCLMCVFFFLVACNVGIVFACPNEQIEFMHNGKIFTYQLEQNIKTCNVFEIQHEINKYNRFSSTNERIVLLNHMLNLNFDKAIALEYLFPNLTKKIETISKNLYIAPLNAKLHTKTNSEKVFSITPERIGQKLDKEQLIQNICSSYLKKEPLSFVLPTKKLEPTVTALDFQKFTNLRADFSTNISNSSTDRKHNVKNALESLNKIEILPNQIFSFNKTVGRRTAENGYRQAKIIVNNEFVDGLGGGVCQVSSTLYNSALLAGLEIIEANKHSKQVNYVKSGFDAMVNFGSSDLKFKNNTNEKLTIITNYSPNTARIRIFGENTNNISYKLTNEVFNICEPKEDVLTDDKQEHLDKVKFDDEYFYLKRGNRGMEIKTYREKYVNNTLVAKELLRHDKFKVQNSVKIYGSQKRAEISSLFDS
jgi:vancomycin resistance protein YoaR